MLGIFVQIFSELYFKEQEDDKEEEEEDEAEPAASTAVAAERIRKKNHTDIKCL